MAGDPLRRLLAQAEQFRARVPIELASGDARRDVRFDRTIGTRLLAGTMLSPVITPRTVIALRPTITTRTVLAPRAIITARSIVTAGTILAPWPVITSRAVAALRTILAAVALLPRTIIAAATGV
ncbi:hypothetical protein [Brachybacterium avium]|uniref:hypothetical protein n=1 Tax=Brachybacterium avium TaxID=2017485 RepID=UPI0015609AF4|nr:hypothetical protein [Brachybacterium avium]